jgi:hypothetical protein
MKKLEAKKEGTQNCKRNGSIKKKRGRNIRITKLYDERSKNPLTIIN